VLRMTLRSGTDTAEEHTKQALTDKPDKSPSPSVYLRTLILVSMLSVELSVVSTVTRLLGDELSAFTRDEVEVSDAFPITTTRFLTASVLWVYLRVLYRYGKTYVH
jgi:hypothetical protein